MTRHDRPIFTWPSPMADGVYNLIRQWHIRYRYGKPVQFQKRAILSRPEDDPEIVATRFKHKISLSLNELRWLLKTVETENPESIVARVLRQALQELEMLQDLGRAPVGAPSWRDYEFSEREVASMHHLLELIRRNRPTPRQQEYDRKLIETENW